MLQLQYYNSSLKNKHINKILNTYRIKYTQMKNEIESKVNQMMKFVLNDILNFLENIEEVAERKHKINEYDSMVKELEIARAKIKDKASIEHKLKNEVEALQQENSLLKLKLNSLNCKINNLNISINNYNSLRTSSPYRKRGSENLTKTIVPKTKIHFFSPRASKTGKSLFSSVTEDITFNKTSMNFYSPKTKENKENKENKDNKENKELTSSVKVKESMDKLTIIKNYDKMVKEKNKITIKKKNDSKKNTLKHSQNNMKKNMTEKKKSVNTPKIKNKNNENNRTKSGPITNILIKKATKLNTDIEKTKINNRYSPLDTINQSIEIPLIGNTNINTNTNIESENYETKINNMIDNELNELKKDEENIELLLDQLNDINESDII